MLQRWIVSTMVMILCVCILTSCGQNADSRTETESYGGAAENSSASGEVPSYMTADNSGDPTAERVPVLEGREPYDLFAQPWKGFREEVAAPVWWNQTVYRENLIQDPPDMTGTEKYRAVEDGAYYILALYDNIRGEEEGIEVLYYLNRIDGDTLETECHRLYPEEMGLSNPFQVLSLDVAQGKPVVFGYEQDVESQQLLGYYAVWFDQEGHVESSRNLLPALQEAGLVQEDGWLRKASSKWDSRGYYCVPGIEKRERYAVIGSEGMLAMVLDPTEGLENRFVCLYHDGQGRCIWEVGEVAGENDHVIWCMDEGKQVKLYDGGHPYDGERIMNTYGDVYYVNERNALVRWDVSAGRCENLYLGGGAAFKGYCALLQNSRGAIVLFYDDGYRDYLFEIANEDVEQVELTLASYRDIDMYTNMLVQEFNRTHEGVQINLRGLTVGRRESNWTRVQADLVAGHGPDLLMADRTQLETLQKNDLLKELSQIVDQEVQDQIFRGVLEYGMMNGGLYSISHSAVAGSYTLIASKELCPKGTWTWEEVVDLLEEREQAGRPVRSIINEANTYSVLTGNFLLCDFFLADLDHCSFLDVENGRACFDTEEFCHLLEVCRRYAQTENSLSQETDTTVVDEQATAVRQWLKDEEILCYQSVWGGLYDFSAFSEDMADLGEDYHVVGYPTEGGNGRFMRCYDGIAINAFSPHGDLAAEFVNYVIDRESQEKVEYPVRKDICTERLNNKCETLHGQLFMGWKFNDTYRYVNVKPDGTSYMPEYLALMDNCAAWPNGDNPIQDIIWEEAGAFFSGNKDARSVANIIQSRVQLYLDENQ